MKVLTQVGMLAQETAGSENIDYTDAGSHELRDFQRLVTRLDYSF